MLPTSTIWKLCVFCLLAQLSLAQAQQTQATPASQATPSSAPPQLDRVDNDTPITTTTKPAPSKKITEKREQGRVTEVTVKSGPSTYTMKPNTPAGSAQ